MPRHPISAICVGMHALHKYMQMSVLYFNQYGSLPSTKQKSSLIMKDICWTFSLDDNGRLPSLILMCWFNGSTHAFICIDTSSLQESLALFTYSNILQETCKYLMLLIQSTDVICCTPSHAPLSLSLTVCQVKRSFICLRVLDMTYVLCIFKICIM